MNVIYRENNYEEIIKNIVRIKDDYNKILSSFCILKDKNQFIKKTRDNLYAMNLHEYQKDKIWEYMNGYLSSVEIFILFGFLEED